MGEFLAIFCDCHGANGKQIRSMLRMPCAYAYAGMALEFTEARSLGAVNGIVFRSWLNSTFSSLEKGGGKFESRAEKL